MGALNIYRRYDIVVRAVKALRDEGIDARALIVANNIWHEDGVKETLIKLANDLNLEPFIDFRFSGVTEDELRAAYRTSDIFVQAVYIPPAGNYGWGMVIFEAMSAGLPAIICRTSTTTEVLADDVNAFFVDPLSPEQIAAKVRFLIENPDIYAKVAKAGQEVARGMTWEKYAENLLRLTGKRSEENSKKN